MFKNTKIAQNLSESLIRPTLQFETKYFEVRKIWGFPYFQATDMGILILKVFITGLICRQAPQNGILALTESFRAFLVGKNRFLETFRGVRFFGVPRLLSSSIDSYFRLESIIDCPIPSG